MCQVISSVDGVIIHTFTDLEEDTIRAMEENHREFNLVEEVSLSQHNGLKFEFSFFF